MVGILIEQNYFNSHWCKEMLKGLISELRRKRIPFTDKPNENIKALDGVFIITSDYYWTPSVIKKYNGNGIKPIILCNQPTQMDNCVYSCVCSDITSSVKYLLKNAEKKSKRKTALYGVNPNSISDIGRAARLIYANGTKSERIDVFENNVSLDACYKSFFDKRREYDYIICMNDFAAVSLTKRLKNDDIGYFKEIETVSCSKTELGKRYENDFKSIELNYDKYGEAAVSIYEFLNKNPYASTVTVTVGFNSEADKPFCNGDAERIEEPKLSESFYSDGTLNEMLTVETVLCIADETDREIIKGLYNRDTIERIAEKAYLTSGGVKYRIKRLVNTSKAKDSKSLIEVLSKYINPEEM